ncbi:carboxypeptidase-like regulatory domain-containing protein, partial [Singulisphaera rosea]
VGAPTKPIAGVVRAQASGKPVAGVNVYGVEPLTSTEVGATTDAEGRFLLTGLPKAEAYEVRATPPRGTPLLQTSARVTDTAGLSPVEIRLDLPKGVIVKGRLVDRSDGHSVPSPQVSHTKLPSNLNEGHADPVPTSGTDPRFVMTVPPGPGIFYARVKGPDIPYLRARLAPADKGKGVGGIEDNEPRRIVLEANHTYRFIDVPADADVFNLDLELTRGATRVGKVIGPDGGPVTGVQTYGLTSGWQVRILDGDTFEVLGLEKVRNSNGDTVKVPGLAAKNERLVAFSHKGR